MATYRPKILLNSNNKYLAYYLDGGTYTPVFYRSGLIVKIMDAIAKQLTVVQSRHSRILVGLLQFNLSKGRGTVCNTLMSQFIDKYIPKVKKHYKALGYSTSVGSRASRFNRSALPCCFFCKPAMLCRDL